MKRLIAFALVSAVTAASAAVSITSGTEKSRPSGFPKSASGITYAGGDTYYVVADNATASSDCPIEVGLYKVTMSFSADGKTISSVSCGSRVELPMTTDLEAVAYDPASGNVWAADEQQKTIREYDPATGAVVSTLDVPPVLKQIQGNYGFESLTISGDGLTMWTANEESLSVDGPRSSFYVSATNRLVKFTRKTVHDDWVLTAMYPYVTDKWTQMYSYGSAGRRGISDLCALPDGSLLVLERELSTSTDGTGFSAGWNVNLYYTIYRITPQAMVMATDVKDVAGLKGGGWTAIEKGNPVTVVDAVWKNYEGLCFGKRLSDSSCELVMLTDAGDGNTSAQLKPNVLNGVGNVRTLNFTAPADGSATVIGSNYRFLAGEAVNVALCGPGYDAVAYTNCGDKAVASASWSLPNHTPSAGTGTSMSFTVTADDTLTWNTSLTTVPSELLANDTFEEYAPDTTTESGVMVGWAGEGVVVAKAYAPPSVGYPLGRASHEKVLSIEDGSVERTYDLAAANGTKLEMMVSVARASKPPVTDETRDQAAVYVDEDGHVRAFHRQADGTCGWTVLSDDAFANGDWIRLGVEIDYAKATDGHAYLRAWINGILCKPSAGLSTPGGAAGGAWLRAVCDRASSGRGKISSVTVKGECGIDDVVLATSEWLSEGIDDMAVDGIPVSWFDEHGLERDPAAVVPEAKCPRLSKLGYTIGDIYTAGIRLEDDEPLRITAISTEGGKLSLEFNAIRVAPDAVYHVMGASALGQGTKGFSELMTGANQFDEERQVWRTIWTGDLPAEQKGTGFYFIRVTRPSVIPEGRYSWHSGSAGLDSMEEKCR